MYITAMLTRHGSEEQKRKYLPLIARGDLRLQAFGVTEPTTGSDTTQVKTIAVRSGDRYIVDGQKVFVSRAEHSDLLLLLVRDDAVRAGEERETRRYPVAPVSTDLILSYVAEHVLGLPRSYYAAADNSARRH